MSKSSQSYIKGAWQPRLVSVDTRTHLLPCGVAGRQFQLVPVWLTHQAIRPWHVCLASHSHPRRQGQGESGICVNATAEAHSTQFFFSHGLSALEMSGVQCHVRRPGQLGIVVWIDDGSPKAWVAFSG